MSELLVQQDGRQARGPMDPFRIPQFQQLSCLDIDLEQDV